MTQLPNPNDGKPYDRIIKGADETPLWGIRNEHTPDEEIVNLLTGQSNQQYWKPELYMNPEGCEHEFVPIDLGKREIECRKCSFSMQFHAAYNFIERNGECFIVIHKQEYPLNLESK